MNITFTAHCVGRTFFGRGEPGCFNSFDCRFKFGSYERAKVPSVATIRPRKSSLSLWYMSNKACRLHNGAIVAPRKFHGVSNALQVCGNPECRAEYGAQFCDILRLPLLTHAQSIGNQHPEGKQGVELCCSPCGVILFGGCPERHPLPCRNALTNLPLCDKATLHLLMLQADSRTIFVYYDHR